MSAPVYVDFLNVGFGQCIIMRQGTSYVTVIDGGDDRPEFYENSNRISLKNYLRQANIDTIGLLVMTHPHRDHIGGLGAALQACRVQRCLTPYGADGPDALTASPIAGNAAQGLRQHRALLEVLQAQGTPITLAEGHMHLEEGPFSIEAFPLPERGAIAAELRYCYAHPGNADHSARLDALNRRLNSGSLALRVRACGKTLLLTTDQPLSYWACYTKEGLAADVLCGLHHGDSSRVSMEFLQKTGAGIAVLSADTNGMYGLPSVDIEQALYRGGVGQVLFTSGARTRNTARGVRLLLQEGRPVGIQRELD